MLRSFRKRNISNSRLHFTCCIFTMSGPRRLIKQGGIDTSNRDIKAERTRSHITHTSRTRCCKRNADRAPVWVNGVRSRFVLAKYRPSGKGQISIAKSDPIKKLNTRFTVINDSLHIINSRIPDKATVRRIAVYGERGSKIFIRFGRHLPGGLTTILTNIEEARFAINRGMLFHEAMTAIWRSRVTALRTVKPRADPMIKLPTISLGPVKKLNTI